LVWFAEFLCPITTLPPSKRVLSMLAFCNINYLAFSSHVCKVLNEGHGVGSFRTLVNDLKMKIIENFL